MAVAAQFILQELQNVLVIFREMCYNKVKYAKKINGDEYYERLRTFF